jgi:hypothetical protein
MRLYRVRRDEHAALEARELDALAIPTHLFQVALHLRRLEGLPAPVRARVRPGAQFADLVVLSGGASLDHLATSPPTLERQIFA